MDQPNPVALATADGGLTAKDFGSLTCTPPPAQLAVVKTPKEGTFTMGLPVSFTIVVSNPAPAGSQPATNVQLNDALPINGGLSWVSTTATQGTCTLAGANNSNLSCSLGSIAPQKSVTVTVTSIDPGPLPACQLQSNPAAVATADGGLSAQDFGSLSCTPPAPQLAVMKTPKNGTFNQGSQVSFVIAVSNPAPIGGQSATNVQLTDTLPVKGGLTWVTATPTQGACTLTANNLSCGLGSIAAGELVIVTVKSTDSTPLDACQLQSNPAAIATADGGLRVEDSGSLDCTPPPAQLKIGKYPKQGDPKSVFTEGSQVTFTIVVSNPAPEGAQAAFNVQLTDILPARGGLVWDSARADQGSCVNPISANALECSLGDIPAGKSVTVVVMSTATTPSNACQDQPNPAAVATSGSLTVEDSGFLTCTPHGSYTVGKYPKNATYNIGQNVSFTMKVVSTGPGAAGNVVMNDTLPTLGNLNKWIITGNPGGCSITSNKLSCSFGDLANGQSRTVVVTTNVPGGADASACPGGVKLNNTVFVTGTGLPTLNDTGDYLCTPPIPPLASGDTATIGFWQNKNGQAVISCLNGGSSSTKFATWLSSNFPYLYGANSSYNLTGKTNADVAALFLSLFNKTAPKTDAQILGGAIALYVTSSTLSGGINCGSKFGFNFSAGGTATKGINVGSYGTLIGLTNNTTYTVMQLLQQANAQKQAGTFNANAFNVIFDAINTSGDIK
jgi:uncharacterized repeat protein (TIGR01451 family)